MFEKPYKKIIECPFCKKISVEALYYPPITKTKVSRTSAKSDRVFWKTKEKYEIISDCSNCGKSKREVKKAIKEGTPEEKRRKRERYKEVMKLKEELKNESSK